MITSRLVVVLEHGDVAVDHGEGNCQLAGGGVHGGREARSGQGAERHHSPQQKQQRLAITCLLQTGHRYSPSGSFDFFLKSVFFFASSKSAMFTFIRRSFSAIIPASIQIDYSSRLPLAPTRISAPERSSFASMNASRFTSASRLILLYLSRLLAAPTV